MSYCCKPCRSNRRSVIGLGHCNLSKHHCLDRNEIKPRPIPKYMGWHYKAKNSPEHQLRCGWRPGHVFCPVLRRIEQHRCMKGSDSFCPSCGQRYKPTCSKPRWKSPKSLAICPFPCSPCKPADNKPLLRITRHDGKYTICTKPSYIETTPSGPYPLKYIINTSKDDDDEKATFSVEAKYNDYNFDYTCSQSSFVLDFSPPDQRCLTPCLKTLNIQPKIKEPN